MMSYISWYIQALPSKPPRSKKIYIYIYISVNFPEELQSFIANFKDILTNGVFNGKNCCSSICFFHKKMKNAWKNQKPIHKVPILLCPCSDQKTIALIKWKLLYTTFMPHSYKISTTFKAYRVTASDSLTFHCPEMFFLKHNSILR